MLKRSILFLVIFLSFLPEVFSQNSKWENYTDFKTVTSLAFDSSQNRIYCASRGGLFVVQNSSGNILTKYTNLNGLINNDISSIALDNNGKLWIGATDGSISVLNTNDQSWKYIYDIKNSTESNKFINYIYLSGSYMFVGTGYGMQKISTSSFNFVDAPYYKLGSFPINTPVFSITESNNKLFAATNTGVAYADINANLNNPSSWQNYNAGAMNAEVKTIESYDNKVFAGSGTGFSYYDGINWMPYPNNNVSGSRTPFIKTVGNLLYFISVSTIYSASSNDLSSITQFQNPNSYSVLTADNSNKLIAGLTNNGIFLSVNNAYSFVFPNSPYTNVFSQITIDDDDHIWVAGGLVDNGFYSFNGSVWENYNIASHPEIGSGNWFQRIKSGNGKVWAYGFGGGPTEINGNTITNFNTTNSILPGISNNANFCASYGGTYDNNGIMWVTFFASNSGSSLYAYKGNNQWVGFVNPSFIGGASLSEAVTDSYNTKWIVLSGARSGVYFFNENGTIDNPADDVFGIYENADFGSEVTNVNDVIVEKNNEIWIATNNGVFIISNPYGAVQNPNNKPRPQKLGIISGNLRVPFTENCISLTNDILNEKWIGTETNGVFHLSADGATLLEKFNTSNSPILSNKITTIEVSNKTGIAYFGTLNGMSALKTNAIEPVQEFDKIIASPNPYLIPSGVTLKIDGLIENSIIKIITLSGKVINEFDSPGGRIASWNGLNKDNELVPTGIYIIVAFNQDGSKVGTGKVAVVRK
ncbi:MAG: hypothetical protein JSS91_11440 [Bacteroidetes bacterium]|nr:hypothetical protein [Bacteroidota bacterium]